MEFELRIGSSGLCWSFVMDVFFFPEVIFVDIVDIVYAYSVSRARGYLQYSFEDLVLVSGSPGQQLYLLRWLWNTMSMPASVSTVQVGRKRFIRCTKVQKIKFVVSSLKFALVNYPLFLSSLPCNTSAQMDGFIMLPKYLNKVNKEKPGHCSSMG